MSFLNFIHQKNHHQSVDFLRAFIQLEYVVLGICTALRSIVHIACYAENEKLV